jgi:hypothetical protein
MDKMAVNGKSHVNRLASQDTLLDCSEEREVDWSRLHFIGDVDLPERAYATTLFPITLTQDTRQTKSLY